MPQIDRQIPLARNVVGWWRGGNPVPLAGRNVASAKNGVTTCGGPRWIGKEKAWRFDGTDDYLLCNSGPILIRNAEWTIAAIVRTSSSSGDRTIYCERGASGNDILKLDVTSSGFVRVVYRDDAGTLLLHAGDLAINDGKWHSVFLTRKGSTVYRAIDGLQNAVSVPWTGTDTFTDTVEARIGGDQADSSAYWNGDIAEVMLWNKGFYYGTDPYLLDDSPYRFYHRQARGIEDWTTQEPAFFFFSPPAGTAYTITAALGTFTLSGQAATLRNARLLTSAVGSLTLSGQAATTRIARLLTSAVGSYSLNGQDAGTRATRLVSGGVGSYSLAGQDAGVRAARRLTSDVGTYTLTGQTANLLRALRVAGAVGSFTLSGQNAGLNYSGSNPLLTAGAGGFTLSGQTANLLRGLRLAAATGTISLAGQDANTRRGLRLVVGNGTYTLSGIDANLAYGLGLIAGVGSFAVTGQDVALRHDRRLTSALGTFTLTGRPATLTYSGAEDPAPITFTGFSLAKDLTLTGFDLSLELTISGFDFE